MSVEDLMARIDEARNRNQEAKGVLSAAASGAAMGISVGVTMEWSRISRQAANLASEVREAQDALRNLPPTPLGSRGGTHASVRGSEPIRSGYGDEDLVAQSEARAAQVGTEFRRSGSFDPPDRPGWFMHSHAERQTEMMHPGRPIAVNRPMCSRYGEGSCIPHFQNIAAYDKEIKVVADPEITRAFYPDTHIEEFPENISDQDLSRQTLEATTRPIREQVGLSATLMNGLENTHIRRGLKALGPVSALMDAYSLHEAYEADGGRMGENFKETAGGVVGGIAGGVAVGAALGTLVPVPIVGTVVGGIIGGIAGSIGGEWVGEKL